ncbi:MAG: hypothetical protein J7604_19715 [Sporocytophaga sp.]|uniref:hypothetical protein n=1 Tax=Sporocytophaga sp. TaxID=2231183 RepID=UPI001B2DA74A|nr:hypothetical protein [Sporocytophaga sp.]MBO9702448.1 hypothetical protein [Sporocytophaga sp.]
MKKGHYFSGIFIAVFIAVHLLNQLVSLGGVPEHIKFMETVRLFYRNIFIETILLGAILFQIISGLKLFRTKIKTVDTPFEKIQVWSGLYLVVFFFFHISAVMTGRYLFHLDTNFYFGAAGINTFPFNLFFVPYYGLAILSFFGHIAAAHSKKMKSDFLNLGPQGQARAIIGLGILVTILIFCGMTDYFKGINIPEAYGVLIGK